MPKITENKHTEEQSLFTKIPESFTLDSFLPSDKFQAEELICAICLEVPSLPYTPGCPNSHIFCRPCISKWYRKEEKCPVCKIHSSSITPSVYNQLLIIEKMSIICPNSGCDEYVKIGDLSSHLTKVGGCHSQCDKDISSHCRHCGSGVCVLDLPSHESVCGYSVINCDACGSCVRRRHVQYHRQIPGCENIYLQDVTCGEWCGSGCINYNDASDANNNDSNNNNSNNNNSNNNNSNNNDNNDDDDDYSYISISGSIGHIASIGRSIGGSIGGSFIDNSNYDDFTITASVDGVITDTHTHTHTHTHIHIHCLRIR
eukprot:GHVR01011397.1.p1 GENE.GHVR01011397.1~~GHVR01011397.1.p1  ORF type:complete len:315 (-),score=110.83 GHVR01011397.1:7-951(-)